MRVLNKYELRMAGAYGYQEVWVYVKEDDTHEFWDLTIVYPGGPDRFVGNMFKAVTDSVKLSKGCVIVQHEREE